MSKKATFFFRFSVVSPNTFDLHRMSVSCCDAKSPAKVTSIRKNTTEDDVTIIIKINTSKEVSDRPLMTAPAQAASTFQHWGQTKSPDRRNSALVPPVNQSPVYWSPGAIRLSSIPLWGKKIKQNGRRRQRCWFPRHRSTVASRSVGAILEERPSKREETRAQNAEEKDSYVLWRRAAITRTCQKSVSPLNC